MRKLQNIGPRVTVLDTRIAAPPPKVADPFYLSPEWRALLGRLIAERGRRCQNPECRATGCRIFGDHVIELKDGGAALDPNNVRLLCGKCHAVKTAKARADRMARRAAPALGGHPPGTPTPGVEPRGRGGSNP